MIKRLLKVILFIPAYIFIPAEALLKIVWWVITGKRFYDYKHVLLVEAIIEW